MLRKAGVVIPQTLIDDTMIMAHLVNSGGRIGLKPLCAKLLGAEALMGQGELEAAMHTHGWNWATVPVDLPSFWHYGVLDTCLTAALADALWPKVRDEFRQVYEVEMASIHVLVGARLRGMLVDMDYVHQTRASYMSEMEQLRGQIPFAPSKDASVREYIENLAARGPLGSWWPFRTERGAVSVDDDALAYFEDQFPETIKPLRRWRRLSFLTSHYLDSLVRENVDSVVRPSIRQVLRTGRSSVTEPALQTLPRGPEVRDAFIARPGHKIVQADFQQAELRVFAYYAQCRPMIEAFMRGDDLHQWVAAQVYQGGDTSRVTKQQRQVSKNVQFARIYGAGDPKIALTAGVDLGVIQEFQTRYNSLFPEVHHFMQRTISEMHRRKREEGQAYVTTRLGRKLVLDDDKLYVGVNYLCQCGATGDTLKLKIVELDAAGVGDYLLLGVHDELLFDVPESLVPEVRATIERVMPERQLFGDCHLTIDTDVIDRWGDRYR